MSRTMTDPIADIVGDYRAFAAQQRDRLLARGIDIAPSTTSREQSCAMRRAWDRAGRPPAP
jgi:hypothetical protein